MDLMTEEEVCDMLRISHRRLRSLLETRRIPVTKVGRHNRFERQAIADWLRRNSRGAQAV